MSTLERLVETGDLVRYEWHDETPPLRRIFIHARAIPWFRDVLPVMRTTLSGGKLYPNEQVYYLLERFLAGRPLETVSEFHVMKPVSAGVWELKTADVRLIGWFADLDCFIVSAGVEASLAKEHSLYGALIREAVARRESLDLDEPKFVTGDNVSDVISN